MFVRSYAIPKMWACVSPRKCAACTTAKPKSAPYAALLHQKNVKSLPRMASTSCPYLTFWTTSACNEQSVVGIKRPDVKKAACDAFFTSPGCGSHTSGYLFRFFQRSCRTVERRIHRLQSEYRRVGKGVCSTGYGRGVSE